MPSRRDNLRYEAAKTQLRTAFLKFQQLGYGADQADDPAMARKAQDVLWRLQNGLLNTRMPTGFVPVINESEGWQGSMGAANLE